MGDQNDSQQQNAQGAADDNKPEDNQDSGDQGGNNGEGQNKNGAPGSSEPGDDTPPVRKTAHDYYLERQASRAAKAAAKAAGNGQGNDDIDNEDQKIIDGAVNEKLDPVLEMLDQKQAENEASDFFAQNPEFSQYKGKIMKFWQHPSRKNLPIETVALEAVGKEGLLKMGAELERQAAQKAGASQLPGGAGGPADAGKVDYANMSSEEFRKYKEEVRQKRNQ